MDQNEHLVTYEHTNSYVTLNQLGPETKNVWLVFHGMGYLSRYFLRYFDELPNNENYIIAPQAPSKYYLNDQFRHVGASWLTKEETVRETQNVLAYIDAVARKEQLPKNLNLILLGFSQGVSIALRWAASRKINCSQLILYAGGIPNELTKTDVEFLREQGTQVKIFIGDEDEYLTEKRMPKEEEKIASLFGDSAQLTIFKGKHEVKKEIINNLVL
ncbi:esterase [Euzebyella marina]|uniref:Esterase n=1 Tax=Euzebyella marina TaxID=1761453 RepID=A0A3G2L7V0_9FLAO|nr:esterase [Euzebyella marina]AYN68306.1 esterase [Euzebyella marina]